MAESNLIALRCASPTRVSEIASVSPHVGWPVEFASAVPASKGLTMNRILQHLGKCRCQSAREHVERLAEAARDIEATVGEGLIEICVPTPNMVIEDGRRGVRLFVCQESDELLLDNLTNDVASELRCLADSLNAAADALCAGGAT